MNTDYAILSAAHGGNQENWHHEGHEEEKIINLKELKDLRECKFSIVRTVTTRLLTDGTDNTDEINWRERGKLIAGVHSEIGGDYPEGTNLLALRWMFGVATEQDVPFDRDILKTVIEQRGGRHDVGKDLRWSIDRISLLGVHRYSRIIYNGKLTPENR